MAEPPQGFVAIARILGARGVRGEVNIEPLAGRGVLVAGRSVRIGGRDSRIERVGGAGRMYLKLAGSDDRETAAALRGEYILVQEADLDPLPEGEFYRFQLIGLRVITTEGRDLGRVSDIISARENDVFVVTGPSGENLIPVIEDVVTKIDVEGGMVTIDAIPGLLRD
ncbi:MAG TPA: ribosome maturation factor RimM [Dehalococcoidia bacterium]|nr:ribosome maturation factor RimM [Dehalococcoidia bacterium]